MDKKILVIAEKYLAASDIAKVLNCTDKKEGYIEGEKYIVTWADGHLIGYQYPEEYNTEYKTWKLEDLPLKFDAEKNLKILPGKEQQFEIVKNLIQGPETDLIVNAGDAGREGYLIQYWIYKMANNKKPIKVLWASSLTESAICQAFSNLREESEFNGILEEAKARAEADYILGMNYSRLLTLKCSSDHTTLPYGRCMTTLLELIIERENQIAEFQSVKTYGLEVEYKEGFKGNLIAPDGNGISFDNIKDAQSIIADLNENGTVIEVSKKKTKERAPMLFSLPALQAAIGKKYKYTPAETLKIVQTLYEKHKILSYPRTDSCYLTSDMKDSVVKNLECCMFGKFKAALERSRKEELIVHKNYFSDKDVTDHHALIPTVNKNMPYIYASLDDKEKNVYDEVVYRFLGIFCRERITKTVTIETIINGYLFRSTESREDDAGFKMLRKIDIEENEKNAFWDVMEQGKQVEVSDKQIKERNSSPPARYTVGNIIELMQGYSIGTPATMAATIEKLLDEKRPFLALKDGKYYSTPLGRMYRMVVPEELRNPELTQQMECDLRMIREGSMTKEDMINNLLEELNNNLNLPNYKKASFQRCLNLKKPSKANYKKRGKGMRFY